jgi:AsmA-like C-terminal region
LHFRLPLLDDLKLKDIEYSAKASLTAASLAKAGLNRNLSDGNFTLLIGRTGAHLQGKARFAGIPTAIDADWPFKPKGAARARCRVTLSVDNEERRRLDLDFLPEYVSGPVGVDATYSVLDHARAEAAVALDLRRTTVSIAAAGWKKSPGMPATARLLVAFDREKVVGLPRIEVKAPGLDGALAIALTGDGKGVERVDIRHLVVGADDVQGSVRRRAEGGWRVDVRGPRVDLTQAVKLADKQGSSLPRTPLVIDAQLGQLILSPGREMRDLSAQLMHQDGYWQAARVDARYANGHRAKLRFGGEVGGRGLIFGTDDLGATLHVLGISDSIVGGRATIRGHATDVAAKRTLYGALEASDYHVIHAPWFARLLSLASLDSLVSQLSGKGIPFATLRVNFSYADDHLVINDLVAYGDATGVTANGRFDLDRDEINMQGTLVPAYMLNSIIGNVPLIGQLLLGGEGQGLIAADYRIVGSGADPKISINPLAALAPGFLRRLFQPNFGLPPPPAGTPPTRR